MVNSKQQWKAWLYLSPAIILLLVFTVYPIFNTIWISLLEDYKLLTAANANQTTTYTIGIKNFTYVLANKDFFSSLLTTMLLCFPTVLLSTALALLIAVALNSIKPLQKLLQTIYFLPYVTNSIAIGMVFFTMFNVIGFRPNTGDATNWGIINSLIQLFGGDPWHWTGGYSKYWANIVVMIVYIVWNALPFKILILLGGLQSINKQYYEAARVDATPRWRVLWRITVPQLAPMLVYVLITGFIGGFKEYSSIVGVFGEEMGPRGRLNTMVGLVYEHLGNTEGYAAAAALILFAIILVVTLFNNLVIKKLLRY